MCRTGSKPQLHVLQVEWTRRSQDNVERLRRDWLSSNSRHGVVFKTMQSHGVLVSVAASLRVHRGTTLPNHDHLHFCIVWNSSPAAVSSEARSVRSAPLHSPLPRITKLQQREASLITERRQNRDWTCLPHLTWNGKDMVVVKWLLGARAVPSV